MPKKNWDPSAAARRAQTENMAGDVPGSPYTPSLSGEALTVRPSHASEYQLVSVWSIDPAPWQPRVVFSDIEALAESIRGDGETEGVGIVEPLLVRRLATNRFELIDGERRWRAAKIVAHERADGDYRVPVRVFDVSNRIAQLIGQAANNERDEPKPIEMALCYRRLREALEAESGGKAVGVRRVAGIGWHKRSQVADYLTIAEALTPDVLQAGGVMDESGRPQEVLVTRLSVKDLLVVAKAPTAEERAAALREKAARVLGTQPRVKPATPEPVHVSLGERLVQLKTGEGFQIRIRQPLRSLPPDEALRLASSELAPAMLALVDAAHGSDDAGYLAELANEHTVIVIPREIEQLTKTQLERLHGDMSRLSKRVRRATRFRTRGTAR